MAGGRSGSAGRLTDDFTLVCLFCFFLVCVCVYVCVCVCVCVRVRACLQERCATRTDQRAIALPVATDDQAALAVAAGIEGVDPMLNEAPLVGATDVDVQGGGGCALPDGAAGNPAAVAISHGRGAHKDGPSGGQLERGHLDCER
jgi:hypothetical protein